MSDFIKDLSELTPLEADTLFVVADGGAAIINPAYKTSLDDIGTYIISGINPPLELQDVAAFDASLNEIDVDVNGNGTVTSTIDHGNLSVGDVLIFDTTKSSTIITAIGAFPGITVMPGPVVDGYTFSYGKASVISKDFSGAITSVMSKGGFHTIGSILANSESVFTSEVRMTDGLFSNDIYSSGEIEAAGTITAPTGYITTVNSTDVITDTLTTDIIKPQATPDYIEVTSNDGTVAIETLYGNGAIQTPHKPSFCTKMTSNQAVGSGGWARINFNISNGSDTEKVTHSRVPDGQTGYDNTNKCFKVPYTSLCGAASYLVGFSIRCTYTVSVPPGVNYLFGKVLGSSSPTDATGWDIIYARHQSNTFGGASSNYDEILHNFAVVYLDPFTNVNHRYLSVYVFSQFSNVTVNASGNGQTLFTGTCNG